MSIFIKMFPTVIWCIIARYANDLSDCQNIAEFIGVSLGELMGLVFDKDGEFSPKKDTSLQWRIHGMLACILAMTVQCRTLSAPKQSLGGLAIYSKLLGWLALIASDLIDTRYPELEPVAIITSALFHQFEVSYEILGLFEKGSYGDYYKDNSDHSVVMGFFHAVVKCVKTPYWRRVLLMFINTGIDPEQLKMMLEWSRQTKKSLVSLVRSADETQTPHQIVLQKGVLAEMVPFSYQMSPFEIMLNKFWVVS